MKYTIETWENQEDSTFRMVDSTPSNVSRWLATPWNAKDWVLIVLNNKTGLRKFYSHVGGFERWCEQFLNFPLPEMGGDEPTVHVTLHHWETREFQIPTGVSLAEAERFLSELNEKVKRINCAPNTTKAEKEDFLAMFDNFQQQQAHALGARFYIRTALHEAGFVEVTRNQIKFRFDH